MKKINWGQHRILVINPFGIGDVLFATPVLRNLKQRFPDATLGFLCNQRCEFLLRNHPLVDHVLIYERDVFETFQNRWEWFQKYRKFIQEIKSHQYDVVIDLSLNTKFGFFCWLAGIRHRVGLDFKKRGRFLTHRLPLEEFRGKHVASFYLDTLRLVGIEAEDLPLEIYPSAQDLDWVESFMETRGIQPGEPIIGIAPCGGQAFGPKAFMKRWPLTSYQKVIQKVHQKLNPHFFIFAGSQ